MLILVKVRHTCAVLLSATCLCLLVPAPLTAQTTQTQSEEIWQSLKPDIFGNKTITMADAAVLQVIAPKRAEDAGIVPVEIAMNPAGKTKIVAVTLVVDANPSPLAAVFKLGDGVNIGKISTRLRVNDYSFVRAIAETDTGELLMSQTYVKATGGCSAPAVRTNEETKTTMGQMKLKQFPPEANASDKARREVQLMIRHPNHSGFQMDQVTRYFIPPHFIDKVEIKQNGQLILAMEGGISISEDPNFRFNYLQKGSGDIEVRATDTKGNVYQNKFPEGAAEL